MHSTGTGFFCILLAFLLLYGGLVVAEKGLQELLGLQRQPEVIHFCRGPSGDPPLFIFGGRVAVLNPAGWIERVKRWWAEFRHDLGENHLRSLQKVSLQGFLCGMENILPHERAVNRLFTC